MLAYSLHLAINALVILIIVDAVLSWAPRFRYRWRDAVRILEAITDPILSPARRLLPPNATGGLDISPVITIIGLQVLDRFLLSVLR